MSQFGEGVMLSNVVWFVFVYLHRRSHLCVPRNRVVIQHPEDGDQRSGV